MKFVYKHQRFADFFQYLNCKSMAKIYITSNSCAESAYCRFTRQGFQVTIKTNKKRVLFFNNTRFKKVRYSIKNSNYLTIVTVPVNSFSFPSAPCTTIFQVYISSLHKVPLKVPSHPLKKSSV